MLDSGCFRCVAGKRTHAKMRDYLRRYGLKPLEINRVEEFVFGNCDTELSDKNFMYPVFLNGVLCDVIDFARITPECPPLVSKGKMKAWDVDLSFGKQKTIVNKFGHSAPYIKDSPFLDLLNLGPPEDFDRNQVPKAFWLDSDTDETPRGLADSAKAFDKFRKQGGLHGLGKRPTKNPVFPVGTSEDGYVSRKGGYDDSQRNSNSASPKRAVCFTDQPE